MRQESIMIKILDSGIKLETPVSTFDQGSLTALGLSFLVWILEIIIPFLQVVQVKTEVRVWHMVGNE